MDLGDSFESDQIVDEILFPLTPRPLTGSHDQHEGY